MVHTIQNKTAKKKSLKRVSTSHEADTKNTACHRPVCTHIINLMQQQCWIIQSCQTIAKAWKISYFCTRKCLQACEKLLFVTFWGSWSTHKRNVILCTQTFLRATFWLHCWIATRSTSGKRHDASFRFPSADATNAAFMRNDVDHHPERIPKQRYIPAQLIFSCIPASAGKNWAECKPISWPTAAHERATKKHGEPSRPSMLIHSIMVFK